jgi:carbon-monoxide dehydrogenase large subunit
MVGIAGYDSVHVALEETGTVRVWTTLPAMGQGTETTFAQVVADAVGTDVEQIAVARPDTSVGGMHGTGTFASRSAIAGSGAIVEAGGELRRRLLEDAAERLDSSPDELELRGDEVGVAGSAERAIALGDLLADAPPERYRVSATFDPPALAYPYATHVCEVEVDPDVGSVEIVRYVIVEDCGTVINPLVVEGQIHGATAQGIGAALLEELVYDEDGQLITASLMDYLVPTASEMPAFEVDHLTTPAPDNPTGAKGVGEGGTLAPPGALANAVGHALGHEMNELPLRPETVRAAAQRQLSSLAA